jgi:hypothetical protein
MRVMPPSPAKRSARRMVLEELVADPAWRGLPATEAEIVYLAAVLHDVAKPSTTLVRESGRVSARPFAARRHRRPPHPVGDGLSLCAARGRVRAIFWLTSPLADLRMRGHGVMVRSRGGALQGAVAGA